MPLKLVTRNLTDETAPIRVHDFDSEANEKILKDLKEAGKPWADILVGFTINKSQNSYSFGITVLQPYTFTIKNMFFRTTPWWRFGRASEDINISKELYDRLDNSQKDISFIEFQSTLTSLINLPIKQRDLFKADYLSAIYCQIDSIHFFKELKKRKDFYDTAARDANRLTDLQVKQLLDCIENKTLANSITGLALIKSGFTKCSYGIFIKLNNIERVIGPLTLKYSEMHVIEHDSVTQVHQSLSHILEILPLVLDRSLEKLCFNISIDTAEKLGEAGIHALIQKISELNPNTSTLLQVTIDEVNKFKLDIPIDKLSTFISAPNSTAAVAFEMVKEKPESAMSYVLLETELDGRKRKLHTGDDLKENINPKPETLNKETMSESALQSNLNSEQEEKHSEQFQFT